MVDLSKCYSKLLKLKVWKALTLRHSRGMSTGSIPVISFFYCLKIKDFLNFSNSKVIRTEVLMFFDILLRTVCTSRMTRDMLYLQCCPTDTRQREEVNVINTLTTFIVIVAAGVTCHLICKWLDRHNKDNK